MTKTEEIVTSLLKAHEEKKQLSSIDTEGFSTEEALYEVQEEFIQRLSGDKADPVKGYKISLTNKGLQKVFHTDAPVYGTLTDQTVLKDGVLSKKEFFDPLVEAELMFMIREDIPPSADSAEILENSLIAPGFEIPDCRIEDWFPKISIGELIADNAVTGKVVVGEPLKVTPAIPLDNLSVKVYHNDEIVAEGPSAYVLDNPLNAVVWLKEMLASQGKSLKKGMIISSGTFFSPFPLEVGKYRAVFDHFGEVEFEVVD
ncbi:2-keto-4-pentenoate hydratase [Bacillus sp. Marseille-Q3570]|uniref:2-keto-4-pentenoate hydratase n=1 Tax=Bacillus sp. Marseille-Q3570 TaxID=2963522 RepID=UPI0021B6F068|nr:2-keto-4-pentenoate hydratase [Bacillus sp. Marseille-Q3570]